MVNAATGNEKVDLLINQVKAEEGVARTRGNPEFQGQTNFNAGAPAPFPATPSPAQPPRTQAVADGSTDDESSGCLLPHEPKIEDEDVRPTYEVF